MTGERVMRLQSIHSNAISLSKTKVSRIANLRRTWCSLLLVPAIAFLLVLMHMALPNGVAGQTLATIISPANGATNVDPLAPFTWNSVSDAPAYYVWVG